MMLGAEETIGARREKWVASIPDTFAPTDGERVAEAAIREARASIRSVKFSRMVGPPDSQGFRIFHGTLPPPPWPATPELLAAIEQMEIARDGFEVFARKTPTARWPKQVGKVGPALVGAGVKLYYELGRFETKAAEAGPSVADLLRRLPDPRSLIFGLPPWLVVGGALAFVNRKRLRRLLAL